jgi:hypothetical protein
MLRAAAILAGVSVLALLAFLVIDPYGRSAAVRFAVLGLGVLVFLASSAMFAVASRPDASAGLH